MEIIFENSDLAVVKKEVGISSQHTQKNDGLSDIFAKKYGYAAVINRLDTPVGGVCLVAKNEKTAAYLSRLSMERKIDKTYLAVIEGEPVQKEGILEDLLYKDSSKNKSFVVKRIRKGVKKASLEYELVETIHSIDKILSLVKIKLHTGRTHQIRVQFSSRKMPLCGDGKYGSKDNGCTVPLWSHNISFNNYDGEMLKAQLNPPFNAYPWNLFKYIGDLK